MTCVLKARLTLQLTDRGRKLKELGSIDEFHRWECSQKAIHERLQVLSLNGHVVSQAIMAFSIPVGILAALQIVEFLEKHLYKNPFLEPFLIGAIAGVTSTLSTVWILRRWRKR